MQGHINCLVILLPVEKHLSVNGFVALEPKFMGTERVYTEQNIYHKLLQQK